MPKATPELIEKRKNEIIDACEKIYREKGFCEVTIKEIGSETSFTRPAIYNYFETKDEIFLALLVREYESWASDLEMVLEKAKKTLSDGKVRSLSADDLAAMIADTLSDRSVLLRIQSMNLYEIEQNSRVERLAEFKLVYKKAIELLSEILRTYKGSASEDEIGAFCVSFTAFMFGVYPFAFHTEKQMEAMRLAGIEQKDISIKEIVNNALVMMLEGMCK